MKGFVSQKLVNTDRQLNIFLTRNVYIKLYFEMFAFTFGMAISRDSYPIEQKKEYEVSKSKRCN